MFLEDVYITGICASHCSSLNRVSSSSFLLGSTNSNDFKPDFDAMRHDINKDQIHRWYKMVLISRKEKMEKDNIDPRSVDARMKEIGYDS